VVQDPQGPFRQSDERSREQRAWNAGLSQGKGLSPARTKNQTVKNVFLMTKARKTRYK